jgi:uncharacterized integral membrane protein (TIGR00698 family)
MSKDNLPGWGLMLSIGMVSILLSKLIIIGGKNPVEPVVFAIILGIIIRNIGLVPSVFNVGIKNFEKVLILGIVLIGASLNFNNIGHQSGDILIIILITMLFGFLLIFMFGKIFKLPTSLALLLSVGTTICGGSAIAVTAPIIEAKEEETSYAIGTIALWGLIALIFYPKVAQLLAVADINFGIFAGTAIHSTPQVVGAGFMFSDLAGKTATAVKLVRNVFIVPIAFLLAFLHSRKRNVHNEDKTSNNRMSFVKAFPWFLFGYFILAGLNTQGYFSPEGVAAFNTAGKFFILLGLAGVGLNTNIKAIKKVGFKPLILGFFGSAFVAICSIVMINIVF